MSQSDSSPRPWLIWVVIVAGSWVVRASLPDYDLWIGLLLVPIAFALLLFVGGPILVHGTHSTALEPNYQPFDPTGPDLPAEIWQQFAASAAPLEELGFRLLRSYKVANTTPNTTGFVCLFFNERTREFAKLLAAIGSNAARREVTTLAGFGSNFSDGTEVITSNRSTARVFPIRRPPYCGFAFPQVRDVGTLLKIHRALVGRHAAGCIPIDPIRADPDRFLRRQDYLDTLDHAVACGYTYVDEAAGVQRATWKGATLMAWKLSPPIKQIRLAAERFQAGRLLRQLDRAGGTD